MVSSPIPAHRRRYSNELKKHIYREKTDEQRFTQIKLMMNSSNGTLYSAIDNHSANEVILKRMEATNMMKMNSEDVPSEIFFHYAAYKACPENVVEPLDFYQEGGAYILAMERPVGYSDLLDVCQKYAPIDEKSSFTIVEQLATTCAALAKIGIVHGDIKLENTLMNLKTLQIKLIDFGSAMFESTIERQQTKPLSTPRYQPPEFICSKLYKSDETTVWMVGAILYILLVGEWCYDEDDQEWIRDRESEEHLSTMALFLIEQTLNIKSCLRISTSGLLQMLSRL